MNLRPFSAKPSINQNQLLNHLLIDNTQFNQQITNKNQKNIFQRNRQRLSFLNFDKEQLYEEILQLKKINNSLEDQNKILKSKNLQYHKTINQLVQDNYNSNITKSNVMEKLSSINSVRMQLKKLTEENEFLKNKNNDLELMLKNSNIYDPMNQNQGMDQFSSSNRNQRHISPLQKNRKKEMNILNLNDQKKIDFLSQKVVYREEYIQELEGRLKDLENEFEMKGPDKKQIELQELEQIRQNQINELKKGQLEKINSLQNSLTLLAQQKQILQSIIDENNHKYIQALNQSQQEIKQLNLDIQLIKNQYQLLQNLNQQLTSDNQNLSISLKSKNINSITILTKNVSTNTNTVQINSIANLQDMNEIANQIRCNLKVKMITLNQINFILNNNNNQYLCYSDIQSILLDYPFQLDETRTEQATKFILQDETNFKIYPQANLIKITFHVFKSRLLTLIGRYSLNSPYQELQHYKDISKILYQLKSQLLNSQNKKTKNQSKQDNLMEQKMQKSDLQNLIIACMDQPIDESLKEFLNNKLQQLYGELQFIPLNHFLNQFENSKIRENLKQCNQIIEQYNIVCILKQHNKITEQNNLIFLNPNSAQQPNNALLSKTIQLSYNSINQLNIEIQQRKESLNVKIEQNIMNGVDIQRYIQQTIPLFIDSYLQNLYQTSQDLIQNDKINYFGRIGNQN